MLINITTQSGSLEIFRKQTVTPRGTCCVSLLQKPQHASLLELRSLVKESGNLPGFALGEVPGAQSLESRGTISSSSVLGTGSCRLVSRSTARQPGAPGTTVCGDIELDGVGLLGAGPHQCPRVRSRPPGRCLGLGR